MKEKFFGVLQRVGRSFMLPIAILPVAGLLLGLGSSFTNETTLATYNLLGLMGPGTVPYFIFSVLSKCGGVIFDNLPLIFAIGVAIGMAMMARACERAGLAPAQTAARIEACCRAHGLPAETDIPLETLCKHAMGDKKRAGSDITLIILRSIGQAALYPAATGRLLAFMEGSSK